MKLLADTHIIMWAAIAPEKLSTAAATALKDQSNQLFFSATSIWEVAIKSALNKKRLPGLPPLHKDPFDRLLIAQATVEGITLLTSGRRLAKYPGPIRKV